MRKPSVLRRAFTLVELLVVIGIIALILSILIPSLRAARRQANAVKCMSNQKQLMAATLAYSNDNYYKLPFTGWVSGPVPNWLYDNAKSLQWAPQDAKGGQLWKYLRLTSLYRCPSDTGPWRPSTSENVSSYVMNGAASAYSTNNNTGLNALLFHPDDILFWEIPMTTGVWGTSNDGTNFPSEGVTARHKRGTTVGYMDGHVEVMSAVDFVDLCNRGPSKLWCDPTVSDGGFSKMPSKPSPIPVQEE